MSDLDIIRGDIAFYACIICSTIHGSSGEFVMSMVWLVIALAILITGKVKRARASK